MCHIKIPKDKDTTNRVPFAIPRTPTQAGSTSHLGLAIVITETVVEAPKKNTAPEMAAFSRKA
jgi:hypothetical protein